MDKAVSTGLPLTIYAGLGEPPPHIGVELRSQTDRLIRVDPSRRNYNW